MNRKKERNTNTEWLKSASLNRRKFINRSKTQTNGSLCFLKIFYYGGRNEYTIQ